MDDDDQVGEQSVEHGSVTGHHNRLIQQLRHRRSDSALVARGESPAAFDRSRIPAACVAPRSHTDGLEENLGYVLLTNSANGQQMVKAD